jgi:transposase
MCSNTRAPGILSCRCGDAEHGRGKRWLLLRRWKTVRGSQRAELRWQRLPEMERLGDFLFKHIEGIAAYCDHHVRFGVVEDRKNSSLPPYLL